METGVVGLVVLMGRISTDIDNKKFCSSNNEDEVLQDDLYALASMVKRYPICYLIVFDLYIHHIHWLTRGASRPQSWSRFFDVVM